jgi:dipeptidyl aminopeptidase/acylaminoacyl peptidase
MTNELVARRPRLVLAVFLGLVCSTDWYDLVGSPYRWMDYEAKDIIGDPKTDAEKFRSVSSLANADKLNVPVLLAYGGQDHRVPIKHGYDFREALDKYGKTYEWVLYSDEAHGFAKDENRFRFLPASRRLSQEVSPVAPKSASTGAG